MQAFIAIMNIGAIIGVIKDWAWDKAIIESYSLNRFHMTFSLHGHID
jgi:hypothetical protein